MTIKFIDDVDLNDWEIETDTGWEELISIKKTIQYRVWEIQTETGKFLKGADTHILFDKNFNEIFIKDCIPNVTFIITSSGAELVTLVKSHNYMDNMYDVEINSQKHIYYANNILSHNTTTAACYLLWYAMFVADSTILVAAHKYVGSQEIMQRIRYAYEEIPDFIRCGVLSYNKGSIEFDNKSRIISTTTTENTGRGLAITLLYLDEFAHVRPSIASEFWVSISPTLSTGGKALITSTPNSDEDQFAKIWYDANKCYDSYGNKTDVGINGFKAFKAYWNEHPDRDEKWANIERNKIGESRFRREFDCEFIIADETLIDSQALLTLQSSEVFKKTGEVRWYNVPQKGKNYVISLDPSLGTGGNNAAIQVFEIPSLKQIAEWKHNKTTIQQQIKILKDIINTIGEIINYKGKETEEPQIWYSVENNTLGEAALVVIDEIGEENFYGIFISESKTHGNTRRFRKGFNTTNKSKLLACSRLKNLIETNKITVCSSNLISELKTYVAKGASYSAKTGETDDLVSALLLIVRIVYEIKNWSPELYDQLKNEDTVYQERPMPFILF